MNLPDGNRILILSVTSGIGDTIMAIPMFKLLHQKMPEADITLGVLSEGAKQLFETCPFIRRVIRIETGGRHLVRDNLRLLLRVRRDYQFDLCMATCITGYLYLSIDGLVAKCTRAKRRVGFSLPMTRSHLLLFRTLQFLMDDTITIDFSKHYVAHNVELLKFMGIYPNDGIPEMELWLTEEDVAAADRFLTERGLTAGNTLIGIHPGGNQWIMKRWPKEKFAALIDRLQDEYPGAEVLIFGGPDEEKLKYDIANLVKTTANPMVVNAMPLRETAALVKKCSLFIANDSSLMHIAAAVKTPVVGIFGPTSPLATGPYSNRSAVVTNRTCQLDCQPCYNRVNLASIDFKCMQKPPYACLTQLPVSEVLKTARELFDKSS